MAAQDALSLALSGYAVGCALALLASPSFPLLAAGVLLPAATALALAG